MSHRNYGIGYRRSVGSATATTIFVETTGNDTTGDGLTVGTAYATSTRALQDAPTNNGTNVTIQHGSGTFPLPLTLANLNFITFRGSVSVSNTVTIANVVGAANNVGVIVDVNGLAVAADDLYGRMFRFTNGPASGLWGVILRNDATAGTTRLYCTQEPPSANLNSSIVVPAVGNTIEIVSLDTTWQLQGQVSITSSTQANFQEGNLSGAAIGNVLFAVGTDKPSFYRCILTNTFRRIQAGTAGRVHLDCCSIQTDGLNDLGMLAAVNGGTMLIQRGSAVLGRDAAANSNFISAIQGGNLAFRNFVGFRSMTDAIRIQGGGMYGDAGIGPEDVLYFENASGAGASNTGAAIRINPGGFAASGLDGNYITQNLEGAVTGNYALTARLGAKVIIAGQISAALGVRAVSSDNGTTQRAISKDGTVIAGGVPTRSEDFGEHDVVNVTGPATISAQPFDMYICNTTGGNVTLTLSAAPALGDLVIAKLKLGGGTVTIDGNGNTVEQPTVPGTFAATAVLNVLGASVTIVWDGTNWTIVA